MLNEDITSTLCLKNNTIRARLCDACQTGPGTIFCEADLAYLCAVCDLQIHVANKVSSKHKRIRVCDACEQAPAAFICKADSASLCTNCDAVIHSANPLSRRHHRVPVLPIYGSGYGHSGLGFEAQESEGTRDNEDEAASWLIFDSLCENQNGVNNDYNSCQDTQFSDEYKYMNDHGIVNDIQQQQKHMYGGWDADSVVPVGSGRVDKYYNFKNPKYEYETSNGGYGYSASLGDSVSMSSMEVGIAAESTFTEVSMSNAITPKRKIDLFSYPSLQTPTQLTQIDREARVLRYREKKKTRKFEKTIRYASRKAYAEARPRIQGRFAKRTNVDIEVDHMLSTTLTTEDGYCIVPLC